MISEESAELVVTTFESAMAEVGLENPYEVAESIFQWVLRHREELESARSHAALVELVRGWEESAEQYVPTLVGIFQAAPAVMQAHLKRVLQQFAVENPVPKHPGRKREVIDNAQRQLICDGISALHRVGVSMSNAQERIAAQVGMGTRTVQRVWRERDKLAGAKPESISDLYRAVQTLGD